MTIRTLLQAALASALILLALAGAGFGFIVWTIETADHAAIRAALAAAPPADLGVTAIKRRVDGFEQGYFPECAGLAILLREDRWARADEAAIRADTILPDGNAEMCQRLQSALRGDESGQWFTYARYWHGSLSLHRLVLSVADYGTLQSAAGVLLGLSGLALLLALVWRVGLAAAGLIVVSVALLTDARVIADLPIQATGVAALAFAAAGFAAFGAGYRGAGALVAAAVSGAVLNYFDFLYTPAAFAMLNAWVWLAAERAGAAPRTMRDGFLVFLASLAGYGAFWALKWAIAFGFDPSGKEIFVFGTNEFTRWGPGNGGYYPFAATLTVLGQTFDAWWKDAVALGIGAAAFALAALGRGRGQRSFWLLMTPILPAVLVIEAMAGHTIAHAAFTFRIVPLALGLIAASVILAARQIAPAVRKAAISAAP